MGVTVFHVFTNPQADGVDPTIARPSDWNSSHKITLSAVEQVSLNGNTAGVLAAISGSIVLGGGNNITLSQNGQSITISGASQSVQTQGFSNTLGISNLGNTSGTSGVISGTGLQLLLAGGNNVTLSQSINGASATITISGIATSQGSDTLGMSNLGNTSGTSGVVSGSNVMLALAGGNNITLSQSINGVSATITISGIATSQGSATLGMSNLGNTAGTSGVINGSSPLLVFAGGSNVTLSQSINGVSATITINGATAAGGSFSAGVSTGGVTAGTTGTVSGQVVYVGSGGIALSQSVNAGSATITIAQLTLDQYKPNSFYTGNMGSLPGNARLFLWPVYPDQPVTMSQAMVFGSGSFSSSSNSSHAGVISFSLGIYTRTGSTISLLSSGSAAHQWTNTSNNSISAISGWRGFTIGINALLIPGEYIIGLLSRTSTTNANWFTMSNWILGATNAAAYSGYFGSAATITAQQLLGHGYYSSTNTTAALPATLNVTDVYPANIGSLFIPDIIFRNTSA